MLARWTSDYGPRRLHTRADLVQAAQDACNYSYPEFEELLPKLAPEERTVAMRLVLLPAFSNAADWKALQPIVLEGGGAAVLDDLLEKGVLEFDSPPAYGHAKRAEAAQAYFTSKRLQGMREIAESLIRALAGEVRDLTPRELPYARGLVGARRIASELDLSPLAQALCEAAFTLFQEPGVDPGKLIGITAASSLPGSPLLAMGLYNTLIYAKQEGRPERQDSLLKELRELVERHPEDRFLPEEILPCLSRFNLEE